MKRYSTRTSKLDTQFLAEKLQGAVKYDRIAGYFCSSILEVAGEAIEAVAEKVRVICSSNLTPADVAVAGLAMRQEWGSFKPEEVYASEATMDRLGKLYTLLSSAKLEIRVLPDKIYGLMHGKAGVITYADGNKTSFLGSINETKSAFTVNYEMIWEDPSQESVEWVQTEFDALWNNSYAMPLADYVIEDVQRLAQRRVMPLKDWRETSDDQIGALAAEEPIYREQFGLWPHQKYFVDRAFADHKTHGGARLLLADQVGLGKTIQLAMTAKLIALHDKEPVLVIVPKTLLYQWQYELMTLLDMPSAVWTGRFWVDENGYEYPADSVYAIKKCPRKVGIVSQGLITAKSDSVEYLKSMKFSCVILDEAHRARRKNLGKDPDKHKPQMNNLLAFLQEISHKTKSLLLATATPVQINPIEAFDLVAALGLPHSAVKVLGDENSVWRRTPQTAINYIIGDEEQPTAEAEMWAIVRNPFPPRDEDRSIDTLRMQLDISDDASVLSQDLYENLDKRQKNRVKTLYVDDAYVANYNPYIRAIVRRTRKFLEETINPDTKEPYLRKIGVILHGEYNEDALVLSGYHEEAYLHAQAFCDMLSKRVKGGGFMSTLLLRRIGSTMAAGENTAKKLLKWTEEGKARLQSLYDVIEEDDDDDDEVIYSEVKDLTPEEINKLELLVAVLKSNTDTDPKYNRVKTILENGVTDEGGWVNKGCILFTQYFDSAEYIAQRLSTDFAGTLVGLYAGSDKSGVFMNGAFKKESKDALKAMVKTGDLKILVGTDAASEGLNLQTLGALINIDLPWNPTRLEQRKGRIQRIGQHADSIYIYNMRYKDSVEDKVHKKLSGRLEDIRNLFGQIPDVLKDVWIDIAQGEEVQAELRINNIPTKNPFIQKYETKIPSVGDWEKCSTVLDKNEERRELLRGW